MKKIQEYPTVIWLFSLKKIFAKRLLLITILYDSMKEREREREGGRGGLFCLVWYASSHVTQRPREVNKAKAKKGHEKL